MIAAAPLEAAIAAGALVWGARLHGAARRDRLALRFARERERALVDAARVLGAAARTGAGALRDELAVAVRGAAPAVDALLLYEEHDAALACVYAAGERARHLAGSRVALDDERALPARACAARHQLAQDDALALPLLWPPERRCVLVVLARAPLGVREREHLARLAELAAPAYQSALERERDRRRAEYDALTGLLTPRAFRVRLAAAVERARHRPHAALALVFVDTDHFKRWNDSYGHAAGDALLGELARLLRAAAPHEDDLAARNGGDEFCLVFAQTEKSQAIERAEALRRSIASADLRALRPPGSPAVAITASIGVAAFPLDAPDAASLLERADAAMYHSKRSGRDGVSYAGARGALTRLQAALV